MSYKYIFLILIVFALLINSCKDEDRFVTDISDLERFEMKDSSYWNGSDATGYFIDGNKTYQNTYYPDWDTWSGFIYSNMKNIFYYNNSSIYSAYPSGGAYESRNFAVAHQFNKITITFNDENGEEPRSVLLTNTTYTALSIKYGYGNAKKFGGRSGDDPDWFKLTVTGIGLINQITGQKKFFLADYRFDDNSKDYIVNKWIILDLSGLGVVKRLEFELASSDAGTPLYFCLDDLKGRIPF
jgi:hypothetical protein